MVKKVDTKDDFDDIIKNNKKVAVDFTATWCGPCKMIGPKFEALESEYPDIVFIKVDVDANSDTSEEYKVSAMPTFMFFLDGEKVTGLEVVGASEAKLKASLDKLKEE